MTTEPEIVVTDPYVGQYEPACATFLDDKKAILALGPSIRKLADYAYTHQDDLEKLAAKEYEPKIKKARGHNRQMLEEAYRDTLADPAPILAISIAFDTFVHEKETTE